MGSALYLSGSVLFAAMPYWSLASPATRFLCYSRAFRSETNQFLGDPGDDDKDGAGDPAGGWTKRPLLEFGC